MAYRVELSNEAERVLEWILKREPILGPRISRALEDLARDPLQGKALKGRLKGRYSYRIGDYRIIYMIFRSQLLLIVIDVGHRRDVYR